MKKCKALRNANTYVSSFFPVKINVVKVLTYNSTVYIKNPPKEEIDQILTYEYELGQKITK